MSCVTNIGALQGLCAARGSLARGFAWSAGFSQVVSVCLLMAPREPIRQVQLVTAMWPGYRFESPAGCLGRVAGIVPASREHSGTLLLAVRLAGRGRRVVRLPLDHIGHVDTSRWQVVLR
jgi:hypothetical protein